MLDRLASTCSKCSQMIDFSRQQPNLFWFGATWTRVGQGSETMDDGLFTNRSSRGDFVFNAILSTQAQDTYIFIATAFFTEAEIIKTLTSRNCHVRLIVRLGYPTSPSALASIMDLEIVEVRYFTDPTFHPKLYIIGSKEALIGSANLTSNGIRTNQEVLARIPEDDDRFAELASLFNDYWDQAHVLTGERLKSYSECFTKSKGIQSEIDRLNRRVLNQVGTVVFANIPRGRKLPPQENVFLENYRKIYQEYTTAVREVVEVYRQHGKRKTYDDEFPIFLEIDRFISFVRDRDAALDRWREPSCVAGRERQQRIRAQVDVWHSIETERFDQAKLNDRRQRIQRVFATSQVLNRASEDELFSALTVDWSFHDRLRFFEGGLYSLRKAFFTENSLEKIKASIDHLLFGPGETVVRMADLIFKPQFKLKNFGKANVQGLIGWCKADEYPIVNGRTTKVLRFFGFDISQLS